MQWLHKLVQTFRENQQWIDTSRGIVETLDHARTGGPLAKTIAGISIAGSVLDYLLPENGLEQILSYRGYQTSASGTTIGGFLYEIMAAKEPTYVVKYEGLSELRFWEQDGQGCAFMYRGGENGYEDGPFLLNNDDTFLRKMIQDIIWDGQTDLLLSVDTNNTHSWRGTKKFELTSLPPVGHYIGTPEPDFYVHRLRLYQKTKKMKNRTVLLEGPSGVGKSVLARKIAQGLRGKQAHTLKVTSDVLFHCDPSQIECLLYYFQPSVFLVDDVDVRYRSTDELLAMFETIHGNCLVILTHMQEKLPTIPYKRGAGYNEGLRPGRIDERFVLPPPDKTYRKKILLFYMNEYGVKLPDIIVDDIVKETQGVTGAYLKDIIYRLSVQGIGDWRTELKYALYTAPRNSTQRRTTRKQTKKELQEALEEIKDKEKKKATKKKKKEKEKKTKKATETKGSSKTTSKKQKKSSYGH